MGYDKSKYETVDTRLHRFYEKHPMGRIITELISYGDREWIVKAFVYRDINDTEPSATGLAWEVTGSSNVNTTNALENCETSAIGRALANLGFSPKGARPSQEEMDHVERVRDINAQELEHVASLLRNANSVAELDDAKEQAKRLRVDNLQQSALRKLYDMRKAEFGETD